MIPEATESRLIREIMERHGASCSVEEFHHAVNVTFHDFESEVYDKAHKDMWESLPVQVDLLVRDCLARLDDPARPVRVLDIGCGTGLATDSFLRSPARGNVVSVDLLDPSASMLRRASERISRSGLAVTRHRGYLDAVPADKRFDFIITSSVLHHVPDLPSFLQSVRRVQADGGFFIHLQDPNGDFMGDGELQRRMAEQSTRLLPEWARRLMPWRIARALYRRANGQRGEAYIWKTNQRLIQDGIISTPLKVHEIFAITDIHATHGDQEGIRLSRMESWMSEYECVSRRAYGFFGVLWSELPPGRRIIEEELIAKRALNGFHIAAAWKLRT
jgi:ubiquinone/menaquinone biosynthesis C-methylase UbiE